MTLGKFAKTPTEVKLYTSDYSQWLASGEILLSVTFRVTAATVPPLVITSQAIAMDGKSLSFFAGGGVDGQTYEVVVEVTTSLTQTKDDAVFFAVRSI